MVSCGNDNTLVLAVTGLVWNCGKGEHGRLGHRDETNKMILTFIETGDRKGVDITLIVAGGLHSMALEATGAVWTWGFGASGQLGHNILENRFVLTIMEREAFNMHKVVSLTAGRVHSVAVTMEGELWVWGSGYFRSLGLGDQMNRKKPTLIGTDTALGESHVLTESCGFFYTLAMTKDGALWTFGMDEQGKLGHNDHNNRLVPTRVEVQHFDKANVISAADAYYHPATVIDDGTLFTWGRGDQSKGLGHASGMPMWVPTRVDPSLMGGARIGPCHKLQSDGGRTHRALSQTAAPWYLP